MPYRIERFANHDRANFSSGSDALDRYLHQQVGQDVRRRVATCFVAVDMDGQIAGYYTLAATLLLFDHLLADQAKRLPRYPNVPAVLLGLLAVVKAHQGKRLGGALIADALLRATRAEVMAHAMVVDAKNDGAVRFYQHLGFALLGDDQRRLIRALQRPPSYHSHVGNFSKLPSGHHLIFYRLRGNAVEIVRIPHERMDVPQGLGRW